MTGRTLQYPWLGSHRLSSPAVAAAAVAIIVASVVTMGLGLDSPEAHLDYFGTVLGRA